MSSQPSFSQPAHHPREKRLTSYVQALLDSYMSCVKEIGLDGSLLSMNKPGMEIMEIEDFIPFQGACWPDFWNGSDREAALTAIREASQGKSSSFIGYTPTAKGTYKWWDVTLSPIYNEEGKVDRLLSVSTDITKYKSLQEDIQTTTDLLNSILNSLPTQIAVVDAQGVIQKTNKPWDDFAKANGSNSQEVGVGAHYLDTIKTSIASGDDSASSTLNGITAVLQGRINSFTLEYPCHAPGEERWFLMQVTPLSPTNTGAVISHTDISHRVRMEQQKDTFMHIASHELRTPLTSLKGYAHVLKTSLQKASIHKPLELVEKMEAQMNRINHLIADLLDIAKLQSGKLDFAQKPFIMEDIVRLCVEDMQQTTTTHTIRTVLKGKTCVMGDEGRIMQVLTNLVSNAIKYSPGQKEVVVSCRKKGQEVYVSVQDNGMGISKEHQEQVFDRFFRIIKPGSALIQGLGLGLYITAEIIKASGGRIWVESTEGKGSIFTIALPLTP